MIITSPFPWCHAGGVVDYVVGGRSHPSAHVHGVGANKLLLHSRGMVLDLHPVVVRDESGVGVAGVRVPTTPITRGCVGDTCSAAGVGESEERNKTRAVQGCHPRECLVVVSGLLYSWRRQ